MDSSAILGIVLGVVIGGVYAALQLSALRKNQQRQQQGEPVRIGSMVPGSMTRVAILLMALVGVQTLVPAAQKTSRFYWCLTISLALAYGVPFFWRLKVMLSRKK